MVKLPKHKMPKKAMKANTQRTAKHKPKTNISSNTSKADSCEDMDMDDHSISEETKKIEENGKEEEQEEEMNEDTTLDIEAKKANKLPINMKSKEEKQAIREKRRKANREKNLWKIKHAGWSGKNGPRAINRGANQ
jgi:hypothetical protein